MLGPSSRPLLTCFYFGFFFFSFFNSNLLKLPIMPFSYFVIQFNIKTFEKKNDLIIRLFNIIVHYMNEMALRALSLLLGLISMTSLAQVPKTNISNSKSAMPHPISIALLSLVMLFCEPEPIC